jgi:tripartite-type tricarboxylate transporter receptor subunit TctC
MTAMRTLTLLALVIVWCIGTAAAADYPKGPVRIIYPSTVGSSGDVRMRRVAEALSSRLGVRFIVENKPGAAGSIGTSYVAKAAPDGYTLLAVFSNFVTTPAVMKDVGYDPVRDFTPVAGLLIAAPVLVINSKVPARNVKELIELAKSKPQSVTLAHGGVAGANHLPALMFEDATHLDLVHVAYKGEGQALPDVIGGQVSGMFTYITISLPHIKAGALRPLAVTMRKRNPSLPDVPTLAEAGLPEFEYRSWLGLVAPAGTPRHVVELLNREVRAVMNAPEILEEAKNIGTEVYTPSPEEFGALIRRDTERYVVLLKKLNVRLD